MPKHRRGKHKQESSSPPPQPKSPNEQASVTPVASPESTAQKILRLTKIPRYGLYLLGIIVVLLVATNTSVPILNPENSPMPYNWIVTYPPSSPNELDILNSSMIIFVVNITASQGFVDGNPITIHARAADDADFVNGIKDVWVGFYSAYWYPLLSNGFQPSPFGAVDLTSIGHDIQGQVWLIPSPNNNPNASANTPYDLLSASDRDVVFRSAGNEPLSIVISYNNGSNPTKYTYNDLTINIQASSNIQQGKQMTVILTLEMVGFFFSIFDLIPTVVSRKAKPS